MMARPVLQTTYALDFSFDVETDFQTTSSLPTVSSNITGGSGVGGPFWGAAVWGTDIWGGSSPVGAIQQNWITVRGLGYSASVHLKVATKTIGVNIMAFGLTYERGLFI